MIPDMKHNANDCLKMTPDQIRFGFEVRYSGHKVTKARTDMLATLSKFDHPVSIKELSKLLTDYEVSTLYRTLETLVTAKLVKRVDARGSENMYETNIGREHHHHITCTSCGIIEDLHICTLIPSLKTLKTKGFASVTDHSLEFFGLCEKCAS